MDTFNYLVLAGGLILISGFWNLIGPKERKSETRFVTLGIFVLGMVVYFLQSTFIPH